MREEIFGPVVSIAKFKDEEEVIELANDTTYGLAAGIFTKDYERAVRVTSALKAGTTWVNMFNFVNWSMPFGKIISLQCLLIKSLLIAFEILQEATKSQGSVESVAMQLWRITPRLRPSI